MAGGKLLILGGIRSGKSAYAESLLDQSGQVRYVATAGHDDPHFAERVSAHRFRRPASWQTVETGADPALLFEALDKAESDASLIVDDLGGWATALLGRDDRRQMVKQLADAVRSCPAHVILVSPEVGLSVVPATAAGVEFADLLGELNQAVAAECDEVALIVAGQPTWLKKPPADSPVSTTPAASQAAAGSVTTTPAARPADAASTAASALGAAEAAGAATAGDSAAFTEATAEMPIVGPTPVIGPGMDLPIHDDEARAAAEKHLSNLEIPGAGLGALAKTVIFAAGTQGRAIPQPWQKPHLILMHGNHEGDVAAGNAVSISARAASEARKGAGPIGQMANENGVSVKVVDAITSGDIAYGRAVDPEAVTDFIKEGWRIADEAVDSGADLIIVGSCGAGSEAVAAALVARITGAEVTALLARVTGPDGTVDDSSWMLRCAAIRDALHRVRSTGLDANTVLSELGGADAAIIVGLILGATARKTPVLIDGPVGAAAALVARDLGSQSRLWVALPDFGGHPTTKSAADVLGIVPLLDLKVGLGEGAMALLALPLLRSALRLAATLPTKPEVMKAPPGFEDEPVAD